jgi:hypothetical protein
VSNLLSTLDGTILAEAMNANPQITEQLMDQAAINGLGSVIGQAMIAADVGGVGGFLTDLMGTLDVPTISAALHSSIFDYHGGDLPIPGHNLLECLWLDSMGRMAGWVRIPMYVNFTDFQDAP